MEIVIANLTNGGLSGGAWKYLREIIPYIERDSRVERVRLFAHPKLTSDLERLTARYWLNIHGGEFRRIRLECGSEATQRIIYVPNARAIRCVVAKRFVMVRNMEPLELPLGKNSLPAAARNFVRRIEARRACQGADGIIAVSEHVRRFLIERWGMGGKSISVIPHGVHIKRESGRRRARMVAGDRPRSILSVGSLQPYRGIEDLFQALPSIRREFHNIIVEVAGEFPPGTGQYRKNLQAILANNGCGASVRWLGAVSPQEVLERMERADLVLVSSRCEACPNSVLECLAVGGIGVSTRIGPMPEFFGDCAMFYKAGDPENLVSVVRKGLKLRPSERDFIKKRCRERAQTFSWERSAGSLVSAFEAAIRKNT